MKTQGHKKRIIKKNKIIRKRYSWVCAHHWENELQFHSYGNRTSLKGEDVFKCRIVFRNKNKGCAGWDVDRHRFFVESYKTRYRSKKNAFIRRRWEINHGF